MTIHGCNTSSSKKGPRFSQLPSFVGLRNWSFPKAFFHLGEGCHVNWCWLGFPGVASWTKHGRLGVWGKGRMDEVVTKDKKKHLFPGFFSLFSTNSGITWTRIDEYERKLQASSFFPP